MHLTFLNSGSFIFLLIAIIIVFFMGILFILICIRKCPSDKIMVIYGMVGKNEDGTIRSVYCIHGGAKFIIPFIQGYQFLDLNPHKINVMLTHQDFDIDAIFSVGISTQPRIKENAAERLLGLQAIEIEELAKDIIYDQLRLIIDTTNVDDVNINKVEFLDTVSEKVETEISKIGLRLINFNINEIKLN